MISFSGIDCSGKSTQIALVQEYLEKKGIVSEVVWSRGGYTPGLMRLKRLIQGKKISSDKESRSQFSEKVSKNPTKRKLLFMASLIDMCWFYSVTLKKKEKKGIMVICDRYIWDTYIDYQLKYPDYDFENGFWWKRTLKKMLKPTPSFCLFIPSEVSMYRSTLKEEPFPEPIEVREKRIVLYQEQMEKKRWDYTIDANRPIEAVFNDILGALNQAGIK